LSDDAACDQLSQAVVAVIGRNRQQKQRIAKRMIKNAIELKRDHDAARTVPREAETAFVLYASHFLLIIRSRDIML
jgi:hypothetical protein